MGFPIHSSLHNPPLILMEHPQIHTLLVRIHKPIFFEQYYFRVVAAGFLRLGGAGGGAGAAVDGSRCSRGSSGHRGDVDHGDGAAHVLWEATVGGGGGGEETDG